MSATETLSPASAADSTVTRRVAPAVDARGCPVSTHSRTAIEHAETGLRRLVSYDGNPLGDFDAALAADPHWSLPHVMKANALLSMTEHGLGALAAECLRQAAELAASGRCNDRERRHIAASQACAAGQWQIACEAWDRLLLDQPQDLMALHAAHLFDFYRGDARNLQRRVARVLPEWSAAAPLYSHVLGMHAFGLEECQLYAQALDAGHAALALERRDPWAVHAVAHVHEMQGRFDAGAAWLIDHSTDWAPDNAIAYHNWWHLALFKIERLDTAAALALLDSQVMPGMETALQRIDATAMLWRLTLIGVDVGERWNTVADAWPVHAPEAGHSAFNDCHALLALIGAGRIDAAARVVEAVQARSRDATTLGAMAREVGLPLMRGLLSRGRGHHADAVEALWMARDGSHRFGGSHAQRDLIDQTLLDSAIRAGQHRRARHLLNERLLFKADTPLTGYWAQRIGARAG